MTVQAAHAVVPALRCQQQGGALRWARFTAVRGLFALVETYFTHRTTRRPRGIVISARSTGLTERSSTLRLEVARFTEGASEQGTP